MYYSAKCINISNPFVGCFWLFCFSCYSLLRRIKIITEHYECTMIDTANFAIRRLVTALKAQRTFRNMSERF